MTYHQLIKGRYSQCGYIYHITFCTYQRQPFFLNYHAARQLILEMKKMNDQHQLTSLAFVVMPDHVHWLFQLGDKLSLSDCVKQVKGRSAHIINCLLNRKGIFWQTGFHDHALRQDEDLRTTAQYIVNNPIKDGITDSLANYPLWDAVWL